MSCLNSCHPSVDCYRQDRHKGTFKNDVLNIADVAEVVAEVAEVAEDS